MYYLYNKGTGGKEGRKEETKVLDRNTSGENVKQKPWMESFAISVVRGKAGATNRESTSVVRLM